MAANNSLYAGATTKQVEDLHKNKLLTDFILKKHGEVGLNQILGRDEAERSSEEVERKVSNLYAGATTRRTEEMIKHQLLRDFIKRKHGEVGLDTVLDRLPKRPSRRDRRWRNGPGAFPLALSGDKGMRGVAVRGEEADLGIHNTLPARYLHEYPLNDISGLLQAVGVGLIARAKRPLGSTRSERTNAIRHNEHEVPKSLAPVVETDDTVIRRVLSSPFLDVNQMGGISKLEVAVQDGLSWTEKPNLRVSTEEAPPIFGPTGSPTPEKVSVTFVVNTVTFCLRCTVLAAGEEHPVDGPLEDLGRRKTFCVQYMDVYNTAGEPEVFTICNMDSYEGGVIGFDVHSDTNDVFWFMKDRDGASVSSEWSFGCNDKYMRIVPDSTRSDFVDHLRRTYNFYGGSVLTKCFPITLTDTSGIVGENMLRGPPSEWNAHDFGLVVVSFFGRIFEYFGAHLERGHEVPSVLEKLFFWTPYPVGDDYAESAWNVRSRGAVGSFHTVLSCVN